MRFECVLTNKNLYTKLMNELPTYDFHFYFLPVTNPLDLKKNLLSLKGILSNI